MSDEATSNAELQVGDRIEDNDPRMLHRVLMIIEVLPFGVLAEDSAGRVFSILKRRIHTDGKPRRSGFRKLARATGAPHV